MSGGGIGKTSKYGLLSGCWVVLTGPVLQDTHRDPTETADHELVDLNVPLPAAEVSNDNTSLLPACLPVSPAGSRPPIATLSPPRPVLSLPPTTTTKPPRQPDPSTAGNIPNRVFQQCQIVHLQSEFDHKCWRSDSVSAWHYYPSQEWSIRRWWLSAGCWFNHLIFSFACSHF